MLKYLLIFCLFWPILAHSSEIKPINNIFLTNIVNAIEKVENSKKYQFGIKSLKIKGNNDKEKWLYARRICENTVRNNYIRWQKAGKPGDFLDYLGDIYCPSSADKVGNINWKRNIKALLTKKK